MDVRVTVYIDFGNRENRNPPFGKRSQQNSPKNEKKKQVPTPGIEPGPRRWERRILTTRPYGMTCSMQRHARWNLNESGFSLDFPQFKPKLLSLPFYWDERWKVTIPGLVLLWVSSTITYPEYIRVTRSLLSIQAKKAENNVELTSGVEQYCFVEMWGIH